MKVTAAAQVNPPAGRTQDGAGALIPLTRALELIAAQVYDGRPAYGAALRTELFDALAGTVCALLPVFVTDGQALRQLSDDELDKGLFRKGGAEMYFSDGRPPIQDLSVAPQGIATIVRILTGTPLQS